MEFLITLEIDIIFVNNVPFFTTMSQHIRFVTVEDMTDIIKENNSILVGNFVILYNKRGLKIETILADP